MANTNIQELEHKIFELTADLNDLRKSNAGDEVQNYTFATIDGETDLLSMFGPGDIYCSMWSLLGLAGLGNDDWTPQYAYWRRPEKMDDGGANLAD